MEAVSRQTLQSEITQNQKWRCSINEEIEEEKETYTVRTVHIYCDEHKRINNLCEMCERWEGKVQRCIQSETTQNDSISRNQ